ncbi:MAG: TraR/DksA C4-type zinc finger protein [Nitrospirae bacterium]|nr:TraR/DksA C4-type zinc finger protein [Nitrospirota bacterium]
MLKKKKGQKGKKGSPASSGNKKTTGRKNPRIVKKTKVRKKTRIKKISKVKKIKKKTQPGKKRSSAKKSSAVKKSPAVKKKVVTKTTAVLKNPVAEKVKTEKKQPVVKKPLPEEEKKVKVRRSTLSPAREEALRRILLEKKEEVWKDIKQKLFVQMGKEYREEVDVTLDDGDKAVVDLAAETGISLLDMRTDVLGKIDRAIAKLDEGTYGICEDCGAEIHENRLKVVPFAIYCIDCKTKREEMESIAKETDRFASTGPDEME